MTRNDPSPAHDGDLGPGQRARLADVAQAAGVTTSIASRVLNGDPTVSARPETRERIINAAQRLSYTPNALARGLRKSRTMTLGMVLPNVAYAVNAEIIRGAEQRAAREGYVVLIADAAEFGPAGTAYRRLLMEGRVDGLLVANSTGPGSELLELPGPPFHAVQINRRGGQGVSVSVDDEHGTTLAVDHLVSLGHTRIAHLGGPTEIETARRRRAGFERQMTTRGLAVVPALLIEASLSEAGGFDATQELLSQPSPPTAIVAASFASAVGAMSAIAQRGLSVPRDVSVVGFHDAPIGAYLNPPLTTVEMPLAAMADAAVGTLAALIAGDDARDVVVRTPEPRLVLRASTAGPPVN